MALKVLPEVENSPIGRRTRWQTRTRDKVLQDLRGELGIGPETEFRQLSCGEARVRTCIEMLRSARNDMVRD